MLHVSKRLGSVAGQLLSARGPSRSYALSTSFIENRGSSARFIDGASRELVHFLLVLAWRFAATQITLPWQFSLVFNVHFPAGMRASSNSLSSTKNEIVVTSFQLCSPVSYAQRLLRLLAMREAPARDVCENAEES